MTATNYYERKAARIGRFEELAEKNQEKANQLHDQAHRMAEIIPFGQPILVGHHSEKGDRNYRDRIHRTFEKSFETQKKAEYYKDKALSAAGNDAISSDAPDAIDLLKDKLKNLKESHAMMVQGNKIIRNKKLSTDQKIAELQKIGLSEGQAKDKLTMDDFGEFGFPRYALSNSSANIRTVEKRIAYLEEREKDVSTEIEVGDITILNSVEENRIMVYFPGVPAEGIRDYLKSSGFRWSPKNGAWQAYRTAAWKIPYIVKMLTVMPGYVSPAVCYKGGV